MIRSETVVAVAIISLLYFPVTVLSFIHNAHRWDISSQTMERSFQRNIHLKTFSSQNDKADSGGDEKIDDEEEPVIAKSIVKIDDGGSDLTDRFKYKVL